MAGQQSATTGDIQSPQAPKGQDYGVAGQQLQSQGIVPVAGSPAPPSHAKALAMAPPEMPPGSGVPLSAETMYPGEPIQTGLSQGPGAGPEAMMFGGAANPDIEELRAAYRASASEPLRRLLEWLEAQK